ncbi:actin-like protein 6A [Paraphysoderma sedebokerense]|nr:actin-like protein 6A [Paraphysoderma sedebokerense]
MATYGGDEVSALVVDVGTCWTKAGYAGDDTADAVFPSNVGYLPSKDVDVEMADATNQDSLKSGDRFFIGDGESYLWREGMEMKNPLTDGLVSDWDIYEQILNHAFYSRLRVNPKEHPLLVTESSWNTREIREKIMELAFEKYEFPAFFIAKNAVLSAFASGRGTALVVESGGAMTSVVPVSEGYVLRKGITKQPLAGEFLSDQINLQFKQDLGVEIRPRYTIAKKNIVESGKPANPILRQTPNTHPSYHHAMLMKTIHEYKETVCQMSEVPYDPVNIASRPGKPFEFPDGYNNYFVAERFKVPEIMFQPQQFMYKDTQESSDGSPFLGLHELCIHSLSAVDIDLRSHLMNNVVVAGGNTLFPGFPDRLQNEIQRAVQGKVKVIAPANTVERKHSAWVGGSILASLGTFHQLWISRREYEETGKNIVEKKCV